MGEQPGQTGLLKTAMEAARLAGHQALEEMKNLQSSVKNDVEMVTQADTICQQIIIDHLRRSYPDHGFLGEEGRNGEMYRKPPRNSEDIWWVIDPIDGTNNYAHGLLNFVISIAAFRQGEPIVGLIFEPATGSMFSVAAGERCSHSCQS
jgi:myo-inositol-1(or 4)-monophosphatase